MNANTTHLSFFFFNVLVVLKRTVLFVTVDRACCCFLLIFQSQCCRFSVYLNIFRLISKMAVFFCLVSSCNIRRRSCINCSCVLKYSLSSGCLSWSALWYRRFKDLIFSFSLFISYLSWANSISAFLISERMRLTV